MAAVILNLKTMWSWCVLCAVSRSSCPIFNSKGILGNVMHCAIYSYRSEVLWLLGTVNLKAWYINGNGREENGL